MAHTTLWKPSEQETERAGEKLSLIYHDDACSYAIVTRDTPLTVLHTHSTLKVKTTLTVKALLGVLAFDTLL